jgi:hypothetical protein
MQTVVNRLQFGSIQSMEPAEVCWLHSVYGAPMQTVVNRLQFGSTREYGASEDRLQFGSIQSMEPANKKELLTHLGECDNTKIQISPSPLSPSPY